ncbi:MAG TPA: hypothetical protein VM597_08545 [Gemmataceae bacterium]|jgi:hypothetical protein|nr:hypothetical protein [Gemmataceae bacterium]
MVKPTPSDKFTIWLHPAGQRFKTPVGRFHDFGKDKDAAFRQYVVIWEGRQVGRALKPEVRSVPVASAASRTVPDRPT